MSIKLNFDDRAFQSRMNRVLANRSDARTVALTELVEGFVREVIKTAPRDSNRFVRAYQMAGNDLGFGPFAVAIVTDSRYKANLRRLQNQVNKWEYIVRRYEREGRTQYKGVKKTGPDQGYVKAKRFLKRAELELSKLDETSLVIGGRRGARGVSRLSTVRSKVYGGRGSWIVAGGSTIARVHNMEPHASIVQRNTRVVSNALWKVGRFGAKRVQEKYVKQVAQGTPWARVA